MSITISTAKIFSHNQSTPWLWFTDLNPIQKETKIEKKSRLLKNGELLLVTILTTKIFSYNWCTP
jgi:hypothetical protein